MELIFIGTSSGRTSLNSSHSSMLFKINSKKILIDSGDGISKALLKQNIHTNSITDIIYSHYHSDHLAGLPSLLTQMVIQNRSEPLFIYTHTNLVNPLKSFLSISFLFLEKLKFSVQIIGFDFKTTTKITNDFNFIPKQNSHILNKHNIITKEVEFISSSFLFQIGTKNIVYTSDVGHFNDLYLFQDHKHDIFITETTHVSVSKIESAATILSPSRTYLTHIDDQVKLNEWYHQLTKERKGMFIIAEDGMSVNL